MAPPGFEQKSREGDSETNNLLRQLIKNQEGLLSKVNTHDTSIKNLETQMGQIASQLNALSRSGLPSDTITNPRRNEECKAVTIRTEKELANIPSPTKEIKNSNAKDVGERDAKMFKEDAATGDVDEQRKLVEENIDVNRGTPVTRDDIEEKQQKTRSSPPKYVPPIPFPQRLKKHQEDWQFKKFIQTFKQLHINIPLAEALEQMPKYAKFLKDILTKKRRFNEFETVAVTKSFTDIVKKIPPKLEDPGSFTLPCHLGDKFLGRGMCDLGASVNLMPLFVFKQLGLGEARPTTTTLQFADRSLSQPYGIIEDILVKVDKFIFPADFIVLDFEADREAPLLLGRPFLATSRTLIDVEKCEVTLRVADEQVTFNMNQPVKPPDIIKKCFSVDMIGPVVMEEVKQAVTTVDPVEATKLGIKTLGGKDEGRSKAIGRRMNHYWGGKVDLKTIELLLTDPP